MFRRKQENIDSLNARCVELARDLKKTEDKLQIQESINYENRKEIQHLRKTLGLINELISGNYYNNESTIRNRIKELTSDYQSIS